MQLLHESQDRNHPTGYVRSTARLQVSKTVGQDGNNSLETEQQQQLEWQVNVSCTASNQLLGGVHNSSDSRTFQMVGIMTRDDPAPTHPQDGGGEEEEPSGYCAKYTGTVCRGLLSDPSSVWFNISSSDESGGRLNEQLVVGLWEEVLRGLREPCQSAAKVNHLALG